MGYLTIKNDTGNPGQTQLLTEDGTDLMPLIECKAIEVAIQPDEPIVAILHVYAKVDVLAPYLSSFTDAEFGEGDAAMPRHAVRLIQNQHMRSASMTCGECTESSPLNGKLANTFRIMANTGGVMRCPKCGQQALIDIIEAGGE